MAKALSVPHPLLSPPLRFPPHQRRRDEKRREEGGGSSTQVKRRPARLIGHGHNRPATSPSPPPLSRSTVGDEEGPCASARSRDETPWAFSARQDPTLAPVPSRYSLVSLGFPLLPFPPLISSSCRHLLNNHRDGRVAGRAASSPTRTQPPLRRQGWFYLRVCVSVEFEEWPAEQIHHQQGRSFLCVVRAGP